VVGVLIAAYAYTVAVTTPGLAGLAWVVPGALLAALTGWGPRWAACYGLLFACLSGVRFAESSAAAAVPPTLVGITAEAATAATTLLIGAVPWALFAYAYTRVAARTPAAARSSLAAWLWVAAEVLRAYAEPGAPWMDLGETRHGSGLLIAGAGPVGGYAVSFVMVLLSTAVAEAWQQRGPGGWRPRVVARWAALPIAALVTLVLLGATSPRPAYGRHHDSGPDVAPVGRTLPRARSSGAGAPRTSALWAAPAPTAI
jgi:apolipoprotein N-acyltransferase